MSDLNRLQGEDSEFGILPCDCGKDCGTVTLMMRNPSIREITGTDGELVCTVAFPKSKLPELSRFALRVS